eukprot:COSAG02_NODE_2604_length_8443_cov_6.439593_7_plen_71_part_00
MIWPCAADVRVLAQWRRAWRDWRPLGRVHQQDVRGLLAVDSLVDLLGPSSAAAAYASGCNHTAVRYPVVC